MPITEYAILPLKAPHTLQTPALRQHFISLAEKQGACSGYPLLFYTDSESTSVHLISGWKDVDAHMEWIKGGENQEFLRVFAPFVDVAGVRMVHVDMDFFGIPVDAGGLRVKKGKEGGKDVDSDDYYEFEACEEGMTRIDFN